MILLLYIIIEFIFEVSYYYWNICSKWWLIKLLIEIQFEININQNFYCCCILIFDIKLYYVCKDLYLTIFTRKLHMLNFSHVYQKDAICNKRTVIIDIVNVWVYEGFSFVSWIVKEKLQIVSKNYNQKLNTK